MYTVTVTACIHLSQSMYTKAHVDMSMEAFDLVLSEFER